MPRLLRLCETQQPRLQSFQVSTSHSKAAIGAMGEALKSDEAAVLA